MLERVRPLPPHPAASSHPPGRTLRTPGIVDLATQVIEVHAHPSTDGYDDVTVFPTGSALPVRCLPGATVDVSDIVG